jgi:hypothetical protein
LGSVPRKEEISLKIRFKTFRGGAQCANDQQADSLERAAAICKSLRERGYAVIPYDQHAQEYWLNEQGELMLKS